MTKTYETFFGTRHFMVPLLALGCLVSPAAADVPKSDSSPPGVAVRASTPVARATAAAATVTLRSDGYYRIPYQDGTKVKVSRDHDSHTPVGRYDIVGTGGSAPYRIVAAAAGRVVAIEDGFSARQDSATAPQCNNNYVWIEHPNGEWTKYSHMRKGTTTGSAKLKVGAQVAAGQYLGDEGAVGCAGGDHLHFEIGLPRASSPISKVGGFLQDNDDSKRNRVARICSISGGAFEAGQTYEARDVPTALAAGSKEVARHGLPLSDYQCLFDQARVAGYEPAVLDMFDVGSKTFVNAVFRPKTAGALQAAHGLTAAQYQTTFDKWTSQGYRPVLLESYLDDGVRYAVVFKKSSGPVYVAYHGLSAEQHQARVDDLGPKGYWPVAVSVVSSGGRKYTALWEQRTVGWVLKSQLTPAQYQVAFDSNAAAARHLAFLNGYRHEGEPFLVAIFTSATPKGGKQQHGLTAAQYQSEWSAALDGGMLTRTVTGYASSGAARYAASWRR